MSPLLFHIYSLSFFLCYFIESHAPIGLCTSPDSRLSNYPSGLNFINVLRSAFALVDPKIVKKTVKLSIFFTLLGSTSVKAARKTLVKLTPDVSCWEAEPSQMIGLIQTIIEYKKQIKITRFDSLKKS